MAALVLLGQGPERGVFRDGAPGGEAEAGNARGGALHACSQQLAPIEIRRVSIARLCHGADSIVVPYSPLTTAARPASMTWVHDPSFGDKAGEPC
jgi:hypothetical protein